MHRFYTTLFSIFLALLILTSYTCDQQHSFEKNKAAEWVDSVFASLTPDERLGQLFMVAAYSNRNEEHAQDLENLIRNYHIGGLIFFQGGPGREAVITNRFQQASKVPLMIGIDAEWGLGMRLDSTLHYPRQMTLGAIQDNTLIIDMGKDIGMQCKRIGIHVNFAPVVDVNVNPANPVIGMRSFGENKEKVAEKGIAYMKGLQQVHVLANAKHFPGHGDTETDSHYDLPLIAHPKQRLEEIELYPFRRLIADSLASMMIAHVHMPAFDKTEHLPTTLSHKVVHDLLVEKMHFKGLIFTDALNMKGVSKYYKPGEAELLAFKAGNDVLLFPLDVPEAIKRIKEAIDKHEISEKEVDARVKKILLSKYWAGLHTVKPINLSNLHAELNNANSKSLIQTLYRKAITVVRNQQELIPIKKIEKQAFKSVSIGNDEGHVFSKTLKKYAAFDHSSANAETATAVLEAASSAQVVLVGIHSMNNQASKNYGIPASVPKQLLELQKKTKLIVVVFGNPYSLKNFEGIEHLVCAYEENIYTKELVPQMLFGATAAEGKLPVSVGTTLKEGMGISTKALKRMGFSLPENQGIDSKTLSKIDTIALYAINQKTTPSCQILVAKNGHVIYQKAFGNPTYSDTAMVSTETMYDVASVTKVTCTNQLVMKLVGEGKIKLEAPISDYLPELKGTNKDSLTVKNVLLHQAGLVPYIDFWRKTVTSGKNKELLTSYYKKGVPDSIYTLPFGDSTWVIGTMNDSLWKWTIDSKLIDKDQVLGAYPVKYSDLGFYIMRRIVEKQYNAPLQVLFDSLIASPLCLTSTCFNPLTRFPKEGIAPTENDKLFRNRLVWGTVHDQGAAMTGGIAGHAGLFATSLDIAKIVQMNAFGGVYGDEKIIPSDIIELFTARHVTTNKRGLGWDKPNIEGLGTASEFASPFCFGHTGFTGTCVWVDPDYQLVYVFLSNRVYPDASNNKLHDINIRTRIHDVIYQAIMAFDTQKIQMAGL